MIAQELIDFLSKHPEYDVIIRQWNVEAAAHEDFKIIDMHIVNDYEQMVIYLEEQVR